MCLMEDYLFITNLQEILSLKLIIYTHYSNVTSVRLSIIGRDIHFNRICNLGLMRFVVAALGNS